MNKVISLLLTLALLLSMPVVSLANAVDPSTVCLGLMATEFGSQSFNDDVKNGMDRCINELGMTGFAVEVPEVSEAANSMRTLFDMGVNFMIVSSADYRDAMIEVAAEYPDVKFFYLAAVEEGYPNIVSCDYRENEAAFLAGALGAMLSENNMIGAVLAVAEPLQKRYEYGYRAGAQTVNPDCKVQVAFTNSYADVNAGHDMAEAMYQQGADFVSCFAGACNLGVFNAAVEAGEGKYAFGAATGQFDKAPDKILASVVKPVDDALFKFMSDYVATGEFNAGTAIKMGLAESGMTLRFNTLNAELVASVPADVMAKIDELTAKVCSGEIVVPGVEEEFNAYTYSSPLN